MNRSLSAVLAGTFALRPGTALTGAALVYLLADLPRLGGPSVDAVAVGLLSAAFFAAELVLAPLFGVASDRLGQRPSLQLGPLLGGIAVVLTGLTTQFPLLGATRFLQGSSTAASVPSTLGYVARATSDDETRRGRVVARFELATVAGLGGGLIVAGPLYQAFGRGTFVLNALLHAVALVCFRFRFGRDRTARDSRRGRHLRPSLTSSTATHRCTWWTCSPPTGRDSMARGRLRGGAQPHAPRFASGSTASGKTIRRRTPPRKGLDVFIGHPVSTVDGCHAFVDPLRQRQVGRYPAATLG